MMISDPVITIRRTEPVPARTEAEVVTVWMERTLRRLLAEASS